MNLNLKYTEFEIQVRKYDLGISEFDLEVLKDSDFGILESDLDVLSLTLK